MPEAVMIFAAGFGTRMGALTQSCPKPLLQVGGQTLLNHALRISDHAHVARKVVNIHYLGDQIRSAIKARTDIIIADETAEILDTGGGLKKALPYLESDTAFTLNSDAIWSDPNVLRPLAEAWDATEMDALLLTVPLARAEGRAAPGDFSLEPDNRLSRGGDFVYTGAQILSLATLDEIEDRVFSLNSVWDKASQRGRLFGLEYQGHWVDVGHPEGLVLANKLWDQWF
ncbi:MAG: nucleotidyltransferase family protein [Dinoroseobacter sp.]|nr:nucleotidyltransferase family protein [Dinoroseobacter sp.]